MDARRIHPDEEGLAVFLGLVDELQGVIEDVLVDCLHVVFDAGHRMRRQRALVDDLLLADLAPARLDGRIVRVGRESVQHIARADHVLQRRRIGMPERILHRVEMIEIAEELVEAVHRRKVLVEVAEMVLAELPGLIAERLQRGGDGRRLVGHADLRAGLADGGEAGADRQFAGDEVGAAGGAARLRVIVGEAHAFAGQLVEVRRRVDTSAPDDRRRYSPSRRHRP